MFGFMSVDRFDYYRSAKMPLRFRVYVAIEKIILAMYIMPIISQEYFMVDLLIYFGVSIFILSIIHYINLVISHPLMFLFSMAQGLFFAIIWSFFVNEQIMYNHILQSFLYLSSACVIANHESMIGGIAFINSRTPSTLTPARNPRS